jgi:tetratricopeptide (TPR) repeat protein
VLSAQAGEFETAFNDFSRTIQINGKFAKAYSNRAALFVVAGNIPPALQDYSKAIELDPELAVAHRGLGRAYHLAGQLKESVRHYDEAISLSPNDAYAIASRADVLTDQGKYAEAAADYERAIIADNTSSQANSGSAWLLATCPDQSIRNPELAIKRAEAAVKLTEGKDAASLDALAAAQASSGNFDAAKNSIGQAIQLASDDEKQAFAARLGLYEREKAYHIAPLEIAQVSYEEEVK